MPEEKIKSNEKRYEVSANVKNSCRIKKGRKKLSGTQTSGKILSQVTGQTRKEGKIWAKIQVRWTIRNEHVASDRIKNMKITRLIRCRFTSCS